MYKPGRQLKYRWFLTRLICKIISSMGCQSSLSSMKSIVNGSVEQEFKLNYNQFIMNTRGSVFQFYHFSTLIHRSQSGAVRKVVHRNNKIERVCKIRIAQNHSQLSCVEQIQTLKVIDHPNVVKIQEYFIQKQFVYIIYEYIRGSTLEDKLLTLKEISFFNAISILKQLLSVINMMHLKGIAHRSIYPSHMMLITLKDEQILKLISFGSSAFVESPKMKMPNSYEYQNAFNSLQSCTHPREHDVYCCGLILLILLGGSSYMNEIRGKEEERINQFFLDSSISENFKTVLCQMLNKDPALRPSISEILKDEIFTQNHEKSEHKIVLNNMRKCTIVGKLKSTLWMFATIKLHNLENRVTLMQQFCQLDRDKDGKIQPDELIVGLMNTFDIQKDEASKEAKKIFEGIDQNKNIELDFYEFVMGAHVVAKNLTEKQLRFIFNQIDSNQDGVITPEQFHQAIQGVQQYQLLADSQNGLQFEQFKHIMESCIDKIVEKE